MLTVSATGLVAGVELFFPIFFTYELIVLEGPSGTLSMPFFFPFQISHIVSLFTTEHFLEVGNEVLLLLSNGWI